MGRMGCALALAALCGGAVVPAAQSATGTVTFGGTSVSDATHRIVATYGPTGVTLVATPKAAGQSLRIDLAPTVGAALVIGSYSDVVRAGAQDIVHAGLLASVDGATCTTVGGSFAVTRIALGAAGRVSRLVATVSQVCDGAAPVEFAIDLTDVPVAPLRVHRAGDQGFGGYWAAADGTLALRSFTGHEGRTPRARLERIVGSRSSTVQLYTPRGGRSFAGGVDGSRVVWQVVRPSPRGEVSQIAVAPVARPGDFRLVQGASWQWSPVVDGVDVAYNRGEFDAPMKQVVVASATGRGSRVVATMRQRSGRLLTSDVEDGRVAYDRCSAGRCVVVIGRFRGTGPARVVIAPPAGYPMIYSGAFAPDGSVWAAISKRGCGAAVRIVRRAPSGRLEVVVRLANGVDVGNLDVERVGGGLQVGFTRYDCARQRFVSTYLETPEVLTPPAP